MEKGKSQSSQIFLIHVKMYHNYSILYNCLSVLKITSQMTSGRLQHVIGLGPSMSSPVNKIAL